MIEKRHDAASDFSPIWGFLISGGLNDPYEVLVAVSKLPKK
jgi:hypothetical protein